MFKKWVTATVTKEWLTSVTFFWWLWWHFLLNFSIINKLNLKFSEKQSMLCSWMPLRFWLVNFSNKFYVTSLTACWMAIWMFLAIKSYSINQLDSFKKVTRWFYKTSRTDIWWKLEPIKPIHRHCLQKKYCVKIIL